MGTFFFWVAWSLIVCWVLKTFYVAPKDAYIRRLRRAALGINIAVLILFFLPWVPTTGQTGFALIWNGNVLVLLAAGAILVSAGLFLYVSPLLNKLGTVAEAVAIPIFFAAMIQLQPKTFTLTFGFISPMVAALLLMGNFVITLLLWHQLQLKEKASHT